MSCMSVRSSGEQTKWKRQKTTWIRAMTFNDASCKKLQQFCLSRLKFSYDLGKKAELIAFIFAIINMKYRLMNMHWLLHFKSSYLLFHDLSHHCQYAFSCQKPFISVNWGPFTICHHRQKYYKIHHKGSSERKCAFEKKQSYDLITKLKKGLFCNYFSRLS